MAEGQDVIMCMSLESKVDNIMNVLNASTTRLSEVEGVAYNKSSSGATPIGVHQSSIFNQKRVFHLLFAKTI